MWIGLLAAVILAISVWVLLPLAGARRSWAPQERASIEEQLLAERGKILRAIKDLEHEFEAGSIVGDEYEELRAEYLAEAAAVYRRLDSLGVEQPTAAAATDSPREDS